MLNTNSWNKIRYSIYQPFYDVIASYFRPYRSESIRSLSLNKDDKILLVGAGTGLDLEHLKGFTELTAIDITPIMIQSLEKRASELDIQVDARVMDASNMNFDDESFDIVILHLILAVIPDPVSCIQEVERVLKPAGRFSVMDKFVSPGQKPSLLRTLIDPLSTFLATSVSRDIDQFLATTSLNKEKHEHLGSIFWLIQGSKTTS